MAKKTIKMICFGPIAVGPQYQSPWEDVWIECCLGKRKRLKEGPCIVGTYALQSDINIQKKIIEDYPPDWRDGNLNNLLRIKSEFSKGVRFALLDLEMKTGTPDIFVNQELIDRKAAEGAVAWYLEKKGVLKSEPRFSWRNPHGSIACPVSLGGDI